MLGKLPPARYTRRAAGALDCGSSSYRLFGMLMQVLYCCGLRRRRPAVSPFGHCDLGLKDGVSGKR